MTARVAALEARLGTPPKTPDNSSLPPSQGQKPNRPDKARLPGPRKGSLGRKGGGRALTAEPDEVVVAKAARCRHCHAAFCDADQTLDARYDKIDLPPVRPVVTRVERSAGRCRCCGGTTLTAVPEGIKAVQRCRIGRSESRLQHQGTEVKRMEKCGIPESEEA